jgi:hypothetical protein
MKDDGLFIPSSFVIIRFGKKWLLCNGSWTDVYFCFHPNASIIEFPLFTNVRRPGLQMERNLRWHPRRRMTGELILCLIFIWQRSAVINFLFGQWNCSETAVWKKPRGRKRPRNRNTYEEEEVSFIVEHWRKIVCIGVLALALVYIMHSSRAS